MKILDVPQSGSLGGQTSSHNRAGQYRRARRAPTQPVGTGRRGIIRAAFGAASSAWSGITPAQMAAWASYAEMYPYTDALGQSIKLTGHQMFVSVNTQLQNVGVAVNPVPPIGNVTIAPSVSVATLTHLGVGTLTLNPGGVVTDFVCIAFSSPQSAGRNFVGNYWQQLHILANLVTPTLFGPAFITQFGAVNVGQKVFYKLTPVNQYGVTGTPTKGVIVVS